MSNRPGKKGDENKSWNNRGRSAGAYREERVLVNKIFLIVCEGVNTEPEYFRKFPVESVQVVAHGIGRSKTALVEYARLLQLEPDYAGAEAWCVYDYDRKPDEAATQPADLARSITLAEEYGMHTAWSNDSIELWFLLHYQFFDTPLERPAYYKALKTIWGIKSWSREAKPKAFCEGIYKLLQEGDADWKQAVKRARKLDTDFEISDKPFHQRCLCTTVYKLVEELNKYVRK